MNVLKYILLLFFVPVLVEAQNKVLSIPRNEGSLSTDKYLPISTKEFQLQDLQYTPDPMRLRIIDGKRVVDIWTKDFQTFHGFIANFIANASQTTIYHSEMPLDTAAARTAYDIFQKDSLLQIISRTREDKPEWGLVDDGAPIIIEYATPTKYTRGSYWAPGAFKEIKDAIKIDQAVDSITKQLNLENKWEMFTSTLPDGTYLLYGFITIEKFHWINKRL